MTDHEFGDCSLTVCDLCFMYVKGHSAGKEQAFLEIEELPAQGHPTTCACDACCTVRMALRKLLGSDQQGEPV